ncbi:MAG TPA: hypothetical protein VIJ50_14775 [Solirubrobacteraceae bacterium]
MNTRQTNRFRFPLTMLVILATATFATGAFDASAADASPPLPSASTEGASDVSYDTAVLNGNVDPQGAGSESDTKWCFEYGTLQSGEYDLGSVPAIAGDAGTGTSDVPVSVQLTGLAPGAVYRYRLVAVNALGTGLTSTACATQGGQETAGSEETFTTPLYTPPPTLSTGSVRAVSQNAAIVTGTVDPDGSRTSYQFQVGIDTSYGVQVFGEAGEGTELQSVSLELRTLQPGTTYHYRLVANNTGGTTYGADATFTTPIFPTSTILPPAVAPLIATPTTKIPSARTVVKQKAAKPKKKTKKAKKKKTAKRARKARNTATHNDQHTGGQR